MFPSIPGSLDSTAKKLLKKSAKKIRLQRELGSHNPSPPNRASVWWSDTFKPTSSDKGRKKARKDTSSPKGSDKGQEEPPIVVAAPFDKRKRTPEAGKKVAKPKAASPPLPAELAPADVQPTVNSSSVDEEAMAKAARKAKKAEKKKAKKSKTDDQAEAVAEQLFQAEQQQKEEKARLARERDASVLKVSLPCPPFFHSGQ